MCVYVVGVTKTRVKLFAFSVILTQNYCIQNYSKQLFDTPNPSPRSGNDQRHPSYTIDGYIWLVSSSASIMSLGCPSTTSVSVSLEDHVYGAWWQRNHDQS